MLLKKVQNIFNDAKSTEDKKWNETCLTVQMKINKKKKKKKKLNLYKKN